VNQIRLQIELANRLQHRAAKQHVTLAVVFKVTILIPVQTIAMVVVIVHDKVGVNVAVGI